MSGGNAAATRRLLVLVAATLCAVSAAAKDLGGGWSEKKKQDGKVVQELKIEAPSMTEEDQYGHVMPERYRCDSCRAVMFHLGADLRKKHPKNRRLKQWEYTDIFDLTCRSSFEGYGIRLSNGENALSGPGLKSQDDLAPGSGAIQMGGETWGKRLGEICRKIVYEKVGEEELYEKFYSSFKSEGEAASADVDAKSGLTEALCMRELGECRAGPKAPPKAKKDKKEEKQPSKADKSAKKADDKANTAAKKAQKAAADQAAKAAKEAAAAKASADASRTVEAKHAGADERVDLQTFMRDLAVRHGLTSDEYVAARTTAEWEKQLVAMAGRIFNRMEL